MHLSFVANVANAQELKSQNDPRWTTAMKVDFEALKLNSISIITNLPLGKKAITSKWMYKVKHKVDGTVDRLKDRLVAKGYNQV